MASVVELKNMLCKNAEIAPLIVPSARFEIFIDLNGDGKADFAFIDSSCDLTGKGKVDTFAIDLGKDGEFDLYLRDSDGNWLVDEIYYFEDGKTELNAKSDESHRKIIEKHLKKPAGIIVKAMTPLVFGKYKAEDFKANMQDYIDAVKAALAELGKAAGK